ncbi:MAG: hypothetical protein AB7O24_01180 [Kofleriaceae bacterium]
MSIFGAVFGASTIVLTDDPTPPEAAAVSPPLGLVAGTYESAKGTTFVIDITDDQFLAYSAVFVSFGGSSAKTPVWRRTGFEAGFSVGSFVESIGGGIRLHVRRDAGWPPGLVLFTVDPVDGGGNVGA